MLGNWWSLVDVTLLGSGRTFTAEVRHPGDVTAELDVDEAELYWHYQAMNLLNSLRARFGDVRMIVEVSFVPDTIRDLMRLSA